MALAAGAPSKPHILNLLGRLVELPAPAPVPTPEALELTIAPAANVSRYDRLREAPDAV
jgi:hypothetical protein